MIDATRYDAEQVGGYGSFRKKNTLPILWKGFINWLKLESSKMESKNAKSIHFSESHLFVQHLPFSSGEACHQNSSSAPLNHSEPYIRYYENANASLAESYGAVEGEHILLIERIAGQSEVVKYLSKLEGLKTYRMSVTSQEGNHSFYEICLISSDAEMMSEIIHRMVTPIQQ
ncbi:MULTISPECIES: hypothetical protein [Priestia]|uniref:hypothetical protein n=1 Tax=Priestia TaxID=2800373 RepID=UPI00094CF58E|nr:MULTISPECIES: hypothetical protein [Priestia]MBY0090391.1 hypothetical protein [Priestia aryabhattai]MBY0101950.1 hypothetical protein [Priestia aryabhattai]MCM3099351.1 hypothetical protein [Priestia megaterium]MCM3307489.1 hypothetical protein [Priestia megaterium]MED4137080.1 hypothetical protein [Priestia megaterium]